MVFSTTGERWDFKHKPVSGGSYCIQRLPSGTVCGRRVNWVERETPEGLPAGHWRHNPRPYANR